MTFESPKPAFDIRFLERNANLALNKACATEIADRIVGDGTMEDLPPSMHALVTRLRSFAEFEYKDPETPRPQFYASQFFGMTVASMNLEMRDLLLDELPPTGDTETHPKVVEFIKMLETAEDFKPKKTKAA